MDEWTVDSLTGALIPLSALTEMEPVEVCLFCRQVILETTWVKGCCDRCWDHVMDGEAA